MAAPYARELGEEDALGEVRRILAEGNGANRMRAAHAGGGMRGVLELLVRETAEEPGRGRPGAGAGGRRGRRVTGRSIPRSSDPTPASRRRRRRRRRRTSTAAG
jgi:hypothetical protein